MIELFVGFPPSVNNYYVKTRRGVFVSKAGKKFREMTQQAANEQLEGVGKLYGRLSCTVLLSPPTNAICDVDNYMKSLLDALTHAGVWEDDSLIDHLDIYRCAKTAKTGSIYVKIEETSENTGLGHLMAFDSMVELARKGEI